MITPNTQSPKFGYAEFEIALSHARRADASTDPLGAIKLVNIALNHYSRSLMQELMGLSDQIGELSERLDRVERAKSFGLATTLR